MEVLEEPDDQKIYCVTVSPIGDKEAEPMKYGCLAKPCTMTTLTFIVAGVGESSKAPSLDKTIKINNFREKRSL